ncbi:hypothetical protein pb186bvf_008978 [Paramecium bursaria]
MKQRVLFQSGLTYNPNYELCPIMRDDNFAVCSRRSFYNKYSYAQNYYYTQKLLKILQENGEEAVQHKYQANLDTSHDCLTQIYRHSEAAKKFTPLLKYQTTVTLKPRFFIEDVKLNHIIQTHMTKHKKLNDKQLLKKLGFKKFDLTKQFLIKKLIHFEPVLRDLNVEKPTTFEFLDILKDQSRQVDPQKQMVFVEELEKNRLQLLNMEIIKSKQFDDYLSRKTSNMSQSTRISSNYTRRSFKCVPSPVVRRAPPPLPVKRTNVKDLRRINFQVNLQKIYSPSTRQLKLIKENPLFRKK